MIRPRNALLVLSLASACAPPGNGLVSAGFGQINTEITGDPGSEVLHIDAKISLFASFEAEGYLDGVSLVVNDGGRSTPFDAPTLQADGFPLRGQRLGTLRLEVPSPFGSFDTFDSFCSANARSIDVTVQVYIPQNDTDPDSPPPLATVVGNSPIVPTGLPASNDIFPTGSLRSAQTDNGETPRPVDLVPWETGSLVFSIGQYGGAPNNGGVPSPSSTLPDDVSILQVSPDGAIGHIWSETGLSEAPRLTARDGALYYAGPTRGVGSIEVGQVFGTANEYPWESAINVASFSEDDTVMHVSALSAHPGGLRVAVQSPSALSGIDAVSLSPAEGKYYGAFLYELDVTGTIVSAETSARDVIAMSDLPDGSRIVATGELPPREAPPSLRIEHLDSTGVAILTHEEPVLAYHANTTLLADGGILLATEDRSLNDTVVLVRLAADGTVLFRLRALGRGGSAVLRADGSFLWAFTGSVAGLPKPTAGVVPDRTVPLLLEVMADGQIGRAKQLGCSGWAAIGAARSSASSLLIGSFSELSQLGVEATESERQEILGVRVD